MTYAAERDAIVKTPQAILTLAVTRCCNFYARKLVQVLFLTEQFDDAYWTKSGGCTVTPNTVVAPDGTMTADTIAFAAAGDYVKAPGQGIDGTPSKGYSGAVWLRAAAAGTMTIKITDNTPTETGSVQVNVTTAWTRFWVNKLFTAGAGAPTYFRIERVAGDLASLYAWGANMYRNPADQDAVVKLPYKMNVGNLYIYPDAQVSRCQAPDAGDGLRCSYSPGTCQNTVNFNAGNDYEATPDLQGLREYKFCLKQAPMPVKGALIRPSLASYDQAAQEIDGIRGAIDDNSTGGFVTRNEEVTYSLEDDESPGPWDLDKAALGALTNTADKGGSFFLRWLAIHGNYSNPRGYAQLATGFVFPGATEADFRLRMKGPMLNVAVGSDGMVAVKATDGLARAKFSIPSKISDGNLLLGSISSSTTSISVDDPTEVSDPAPNAATAETFDASGVRTGGPDWVVTLIVDSEEMNVVAKTNGDNPLTVQRGRWGTAAAAHANRAAFQEVIEFGTEQSVPGNPVLGKNYLDVKVGLYRRGGIPAASINTALIYAQRDTWAYSSIDPVFAVTSGTLCRRRLTEPTSIDDLLQEIDRDLVSYQYVDENQLVCTRIFANPTPSEAIVELTDVSNFIERTVSVEDVQEARLSRVIVAWNLKTDASGDKVGDYLNTEIAIEQQQETPGFFGTIRDRVMLSQWIPAADQVLGRALAERMLARFRKGARLIVGSLEAKDDDNVALGTFAYATTRVVQAPNGTPQRRLVQVVKKVRDSDGSRMTITFLDTALLHKIMFIAPNGQPDYDAATEQQRRYWYIGDANNKVGTAKDDGSYVR